MTFFTDMTWYQQAATSFFCGFLPVYATSLVLGNRHRERKAVTSPVPPSYVPPYDGSLRLPGILAVPSSGEPVTPTIVYTTNYHVYRAFCTQCRIAPDSANLLFAGDQLPSPIRKHRSNAKWKHVAFVSIDPRRGYYPYSEAWADLERLRSFGNFTQAFYYPSPFAAVPNFTDAGREW